MTITRGFLVNLAVFAVTLVAAAVLRFPGLLTAVAALGIPVLFGLYLTQLVPAGAQAGRLVAAALSGVALGVTFALFSGAVVSRSYGVPFESGIAAVYLRAEDAVVILVSVVLVMLPAVIIRLVSPGPRETLYGFVFGAGGALCFAASTTVVRMFAQLNSGLVDRDQPLADLLIEAGIRGMAVPVTAAAVGGMVGAALWFDAARHRGPARRTLVLSAAVSVAAHVWLGEEDSANISQWAKVAWHFAVAVLAVLLLRFGMRRALRSERGQAGGVPFVRPLSTGRLVTLWSLVIAIVAAGLIGISASATEPSERYMCPPNCGRPSLGRPVATNPVYTRTDGAFSVSYPLEGSAYSVVTGTDGVTATFTAGGGGVMRLFGESARGRSAKDIATELADQYFPDSRMAYEIPNTLVGYHPGYGVALDDWPDGTNIDETRIRILLMVAVKDDLALVAGAVGPYHELGSGSGPPTGASLELAEDMGKYVNSFRWRSDPPR